MSNMGIKFIGLAAILAANCTDSDFAGRTGAPTPQPIVAEGNSTRDDFDDQGDDNLDDSDNRNSTDRDESDTDGEFLDDTDDNTDDLDQPKPKTKPKDSGGSGTAVNTAVEQDEIDYACKRGQKGLAGKVFQLAKDTPALPDFGAMQPIGQVSAVTLNVPDRSWTTGFPGVPSLVEWFGIRFDTVINLPTTGTYQFRTNSDDGSKVYLNKELVVNNDGTHGPTRVDSQQLQLKAGEAGLRIDWFQGPRTQIALQLYWKTPGSNNFVIVPAEFLTHGEDCKLQNIGKFE